MGSSPPSREERLAALLSLQRLLSDAERALADGDQEDIKTSLREAGKAFHVWSRQHKGRLEPEPKAPIVEARRTALLTLATLLAQTDEAVSRGDAQAVKSGLDKTKRALELSRKLDGSSESSGFRLRFPRKIAK
jgi:hypothetical protein